MIPERSLVLVLFLLLLCSAASDAKSSDAQNLEYGIPNSITVNTDPPGATIYLDDKLIASRSNTLIRNVNDGIHTLKIVLPGYVEIERYIDVDPSGTTLVDVILEKNENTFKIVTNPKGADIYINNEYMGKTDQDLVLDEGKQYTISLSLDGYYQYSETVQLREKTQLNAQHDIEGIYHDFEKLPVFGTFSLYSIPDAADVYIDGTLSGTTNMVSRNIEPGYHVIRVSKIGYDDNETTVLVSVEKSSDLRMILRPSDGEITISSEPVSSTVYIDDLKVGITPYSGKFTQGKHRIKIESSAFDPVSREIDLNYQGLELVIQMTPQAIAEISKTEEIITVNEKYGPDKAKQVLNQSREQLQNKDYVLSLESAKQAAVLAKDVDEDMIPNWLDIQPTVKNTYVYVLPFVILLGIIVFIWYDWRKCQVIPTIEMRVDDASSNEEVIAHVNLEVEKDYISMVCTISLDNMIFESVAKTGENLVNLGILTKGKHTLSAGLSIKKKRYGLTTVSKTIDFEVK